MQFKNFKGRIDESIEIPILGFEVEQNSVNYIGDIYLNFYDKEENVFYISYKNIHDPTEAAVAGFMGGALGGAIYGAVKAAAGSDGIHRFSIENNKDFSSSINLQKKTQLISQK
jgi:hypothetical protein